MKRWAIETTVVPSNNMKAFVSGWRDNRPVEANTPQQAIAKGFRQLKVGLDRRIKRAMQLGGLRVTAKFIGEAMGTMTPEEVLAEKKATGNVVTRKCDQCHKPIRAAHAWAIKGRDELFDSDSCMEQFATNINLKQYTKKETSMTAKKTKQPKTEEVAELETVETTETEPVAAAAPAKGKKTAKKKAAKAPTKPAPAGAGEPLTVAQQLAAIPKPVRSKEGIFPAEHPLGIIATNFGAKPDKEASAKYLDGKHVAVRLDPGSKAKTLNISDAIKGISKDFAAENQLKSVLNWYGKDGKKFYLTFDTKAKTVTLNPGVQK